MSNFINSQIEKGIISYVIMTEDFSHIEDMKESDFGNPSARKVFHAIHDLFHSFKPINENFIRQHLSKYDIEEYDLLEVMCESPLMPNKDYKEMIKELADKRRLSLMLRTAIAELPRTSSMQVAQGVIKSCTELTENMFETESTFDMISLSDINEEPVQFVGLNYLPLPRKSAILLAGRGGVGKSGVALQCAIRHIIETGENVFAWLSEDPLGETKMRAQKICRQLGLSFESIASKLIVTNKKPFNIAINFNDNIIVNPELAKLQNATKHCGLIIIDPLRSFASNFDENSNSDMDNVTKELSQWAKKEDKIIVAIHHANKEGDIRGASSIVDASRLAYVVTDVDGAVKNVAISKDNFGVAAMIRSKSIKISSIKE